MFKNLFVNKLRIQGNRNQTLSAIALILMLTLCITPLLNPKTTTVNAQTTSSNLLQYEWTSDRASPTGSFYSAGPGPNSPNIQWKTSIPGITGPMVAFNGLVFAQDAQATYALDGFTGDVVWTHPGLGVGFYGMAGNIAKIDDTYMVIASPLGGAVCVKIADGTTVWTMGPEFAGLASAFSGAGYVPELKMFIDASFGWNLPDPSKPPTLAWNLTAQQDVGMYACVYGDGKVFIGGGDMYLRAYDAKTGTQLWQAPLTSAFLYGASYIDGKVIQGGLDNNMRAWDANTGALLWTYNPHTYYGEWASSTAVAYGIVYEHNQDTYLYAVNASTGELIWRENGPGIGYSNILAIADGKVYCNMGESQYRDFATGQYGYSEYDCFDAYTGKLIWTLPMENGAPQNSECIAYGNLYVIPKYSTGVPGVWTYTFGGGGLSEVWCISGQASQVKDWPMFLADPAHTAEGAGPTNLQVNWKFTAGAGMVSSPTLVNGVCYFGCLDSNIYAIDASTGSMKWTFQTGYQVKSTVAVVNGKLFTGADDGNIYCLDANTGSKLWETPAGGITISPLGIGLEAPVRSSPMVVGNKVYVGSLDGNLYCLDTNSGNVLWKYQTGGQILATPSIVDNAVYVASCNQPVNGILFKLDANSGAVIWQKDIPYVLDKTLGSGNFLFASPTVADGMVFVRSGLRMNYALNAATGATIWTYDGRFNPGTPQQSGGVIQQNAVLYKNGAVYFNDFYGITCRNATDGTEVWYTYLSRENLSPGLSYAYGRIYTVAESGVLYVLDASSGAKLSFYTFENQVHSTPTPYNGSLYVAGNDWNVYCFGDARILAAQTQPVTTSTPAPTSTASVAPTATPSPTVVTTAAETSILTYGAIAISVAAITIASATLLLRKRKT